MAKVAIAYIVIRQPDGYFAVTRMGGDLPDQVLLVFRGRKHADAVANELNRAYIAGWHDSLVEELARRREVAEIKEAVGEAEQRELGLE